MNWGSYIDKVFKTSSICFRNKYTYPDSDQDNQYNYFNKYNQYNNTDNYRDNQHQ